MQIKAITQIENNHLKLTIMKREEVKINGKPISKCSYEELLDEAKKFTETKGKGMQELRNEVIKGQRKKEEKKKEEKGGYEHSDNNTPTQKGVKVVVKKEDAKLEEKPNEEPKPAQSNQGIKEMKAPFRTKVFLLSQQGMTAKEACIFLERTDRLRSAKKAIASYNNNEKLKNKAQKYLK